MELYGGAPFWLLRDALSEAADPLPAAVDVVVIGAGITGALIADALVTAGFRVAVVDRRSVTAGSTVASTALLLYQLDTELGQLAETIGQDGAVRVYRRMAAALTRLEALAATLPDDTGFRRRDSLYLASRPNHARRLRHEAALLRGAGLDALWLPSAVLRVLHGIAAHGAIHTDHAADVDPVRLARALLVRARTAGATLSGRTTVTAFVSRPDGVQVVTDGGEISARWCVCAMGYETPPGLTPPTVILHSSFAFATTPLREGGPLRQGTMIWESARPYFYARTTVDGRLLAGGADLPLEDPAERDAQLPVRTAILEGMTRTWFPELTFEVATAWCGTFAETTDGLPCIGPLAEAPRVLLALCAGGNGIPFAAIAAEILTAHCLGTPDPDASLFDPSR